MGGRIVSLHGVSLALGRSRLRPLSLTESSPSRRRSSRCWSPVVFACSVSGKIWTTSRSTIATLICCSEHQVIQRSRWGVFRKAYVLVLVFGCLGNQLFMRARKAETTSQGDPVEYMGDPEGFVSPWQRNYFVENGELSERVVDVRDDQSSRRQLIKLSDVEARARYPDHIVASLGAIRMDTPGGVVTTRVLFDGTHAM